MLNSRRSVSVVTINRILNQTFLQLFQFLSDRNPQVRQIALSNLVGQTAKESPHRNIFFEGLKESGLQAPQETGVIHDLKLLCHDQLV